MFKKVFMNKWMLGAINLVAVVVLTILVIMHLVLMENLGLILLFQSFFYYAITMIISFVSESKSEKVEVQE